MAKSCETCTHFSPEPGNKKQGACREAPPKVFMLGMAKDKAGNPFPLTTSQWPPIMASQWCGRWVPREAN